MPLDNIQAIGLQTAQGLVFTEAYYWDQNEETRAFPNASGASRKAADQVQASMWGAVAHYLKAVQAAGTDAAEPVMAKMRELPVTTS